MLETCKLKLTSDAPLILHNGQTADPLNHFSKELKRISSKRKKTEEDLAEMARIEWYAGLYVDQNNWIILPTDLIDACLWNGAKKLKLGTIFQSACFATQDAVLEFDGQGLPLDELWEQDKNRFTRAVRVQRNKVMRTRPIFYDWSAVIELKYETTLLNESQIVDIADAAGIQVGIGDWRPRYGRFTVEKV